MPPSLSVELKREFMFSVVLKEAAVVLQLMLKTDFVPKLACRIPPGVRREVPDIESEFLGLGFPGAYVSLPGEAGVHASVGVITSVRPYGHVPHAYFAGGRTQDSKAVVASFAIAVSRLVDSPIVDGSGHWMPQDEFTADDLMAAMSSA